jgi:hypothetical protein
MTGFDSVVEAELNQTLSQEDQDLAQLGSGEWEYD